MTRPASSPAAADLRAALQRHFGLDAFRGRQEEAIRAVLGGRDALVVMPTGEGKSLIYQLPAMLQDGVTLVVSPLIALMEDQVAALRARGLPAACVHSLLERGEREHRLAAARAGEVRLLYVTPERFRVPGFLDVARSLRVPLLAVDEAHCVSQWGFDFRPDYARLGEARAALGSPVCVALTATATPQVQDDIVRVLGLREPLRVHTGIERPNLFLAAQRLDEDEAKLARVRTVLAEVGGPGIVYCALIQDLLRLEGELRRDGYDPLVYHGDLSASERREMHERFRASSDGLVLATNAFGMGVDKPDIRFILHWQVPRTLEAYYQEIGRAGRDGRAALCELLYAEADVSIQRDFLEWANPGADFVEQIARHLASLGERLHAVDVDALRAEFLVKNRRDGRVETALRLLATAGCTRGTLGRDFEWLRTPARAELEEWQPAGKRERDLRGLLGMVRYANATTCRKDVVHDWFGLPGFSGDCGACDVCAEESSWLATRLPPAERRPVPMRTEAAADEVVRRGDWLEVRGFGLCHVLRVHRTRRGTRADVELAGDLTRRSIDLGQGRWRKVR